MRLSALEPKMRVVLSRYAQRGFRHSYEDLMEWKPLRTKVLVSPLTTVLGFEEFVWRQNLSYTGVSDFVADANLDMVRVLLVTSDGMPMEGYRKLVHYQVLNSYASLNNQLEQVGRQMKVNFCVIERQAEETLRCSRFTSSNDFDVTHLPQYKHTSSDTLQPRAEVEERPRRGIKQSRVNGTDDLDICEEVWRLGEKEEGMEKVQTGEFAQTAEFDFELVNNDIGWVEVNGVAKVEDIVDDDWSAVYFDGNEESFEAQFV